VFTRRLVNPFCGLIMMQLFYEQVSFFLKAFYFSICSQGGPRIAKKDLGSFFTKMTFGLELTKYVSGHLSIYGNGISIFV